MQTFAPGHMGLCQRSMLSTVAERASFASGKPAAARMSLALSCCGVLSCVWRVITSACRHHAYMHTPGCRAAHY